MNRRVFLQRGAAWAATGLLLPASSFDAISGRRIDPLQFGAAADGTTDDLAAIDAAIQAADISGGEVDLGGRSYGIAPGYVHDKDVTVRNGTLIVRNTGDYASAYRLNAGKLVNVKLDQSQVIRHNGDGEGFQILGDDVECHRCEAIGERSVRNEENQHPFRVYGDNVRLVNCISRDASGSALRAKETENLYVVNFQAINYRLKGFGYDSDVDGAGSIYIDGYYSESDSTDKAVNGFLIDPGPSRDLGFLSIKGLHVNVDAGNGAKIEYLGVLHMDDIHLSAPNGDNGLKIDNVDYASIGSLWTDNRFKIEPPCGPVHIRKLVSDIAASATNDTCVQNASSSRVTIDEAILKGCTRGVDSNFSSMYPHRATWLRRVVFHPKSRNDGLFFSGNWDPRLFVLGDVKWENSTDYFDLAAGDNKRAQVRRNFHSPPLYEANDIPPNMGLRNTGYVDGAKITQLKPDSGDTAWWRYDADGDTWLAGPTL